ncbi:MAG: hypothetical protein JXB05_28520 [Myxococcaceae bacterium]|nr:hypothetical protein [Myxococcaceae bacterium]
MSSVLVECRCGFAIPSGDAGLPYRAELIRSQSQAAFVGGLSGNISELLEFASKGKRREWILTRMGADYPEEASTEEIVEDLFEQQRFRHGLHAVQCPQCGTLYVEKSPSVWKYWLFSPLDAPSNIFLAQN